MRQLLAHQLIPARRRLITDESDLPQRAVLSASQTPGRALARSVLELLHFDAVAAERDRD